MFQYRFFHNSKQCLFLHPCSYCHSVDRIFNILFTGQVLSSAVSILSTFCVILTQFHLISVIYLIVSAYSMCVYCVVGTKIEYAVSSNQNQVPYHILIAFVLQYDQVYDSICSISWQELNMAQRKLYSLTLKEAQNAKTMMMLGIMPLSVRTALQASCGRDWGAKACCE